MDREKLLGSALRRNRPPLLGLDTVAEEIHGLRLDAVNNNKDGVSKEQHLKSLKRDPPVLVLVLFSSNLVDSSARCSQHIPGNSLSQHAQHVCFFLHQVDTDIPASRPHKRCQLAKPGGQSLYGDRWFAWPELRAFKGALWRQRQGLYSGPIQRMRRRGDIQHQMSLQCKRKRCQEAWELEICPDGPDGLGVGQNGGSRIPRKCREGPDGRLDIL